MGLLESFLVSLGLIVSAVYLIFQHFHSYWSVRNVPHDPPQLLYGNAKKLGKTMGLADLTLKYYKKFKDQGPFFGMYIFVKPLAVITDLDLIKNILIRDFNYFTDRGIFYNQRDDPISGHLFSLDGPEWRFMRTKLTPTFTSGKMKFMFPTILKVGHEFEDTIAKVIEENQVVEIRELLARFTTDVIGSCAFGIDCNSLKDQNTEFRRHGRDFFTKRRNGSMRQSLMGTFPNLARSFRMKVVKDEISKFFTDVVRETIEYREENNVHRNDFMDLLIAIKNSDGSNTGLTLGQMVAQSFVFFVAGFETSSTAMAYALYELAQNELIQNKLREEIKDVLRKHNGNFTYESMIEMTYLDQVINETLRKYPPVPVLFRRAIKDYPVPGTNFVLEKGRDLFIPCHAIQNDPQYYPKPDVFDPDRFAPQECIKRHSSAFLPFGDGPRNCIGLRFGRMQTRVGLVLLLQRYKFSVCPNTETLIEFTNKSFILAPKDGIHLKIENL